ncbi:hypothetical protein N3C_0378 [Clostridium sp. N3C]|uniref:hypothetical protein n=1 Tax=Clostridium sp. N3C TaxID=1776758 RepID=UPI00092DEED9|nr:hypothetical protein [Clostridium sp. N3C]SCN21707.1 hypothetical protein N3C_0378 [Clostridium sp. N3C]
MVFKDIDKKDSIKLAEKVRKAVEKETKNCLYPTTISVGVAHFPSDDNYMEAMEKLYIKGM